MTVGGPWSGRTQVSSFRVGPGSAPLLMLAPLGVLDPLGPRSTVWEGACAHTSAKDQPYYGAANRAEESRRTGERIWPGQKTRLIASIA